MSEWSDKMLYRHVFFNFALECYDAGWRKPGEIEIESDTLASLNADDDDLLGGNMHTIKREREREKESTRSFISR